MILWSKEPYSLKKKPEKLFFIRALMAIYL